VLRILSMYKFIFRAGSNLTTFGRLKSKCTKSSHMDHELLTWWIIVAREIALGSFVEGL
jgi:hypothetical protein